MSLRNNLLANLAGKGWTALMALIFTPFYIHQLGIEGYGLIGFFNSLVIFSFLLDLGFSGALNREFARLSIERQANIHEMRDMLRTLEAICWTIAILIGFGVVASASWISAHWFQAETFSQPQLKSLLILMGLALAFQWPFSLYSSGLIGLQQQVRLNIVVISVASIRYAAPFAASFWVPLTAELFFCWQLLVSLLQTSLTGIVLWVSLRNSERAARFDKNRFKQIWRFALGMGGISATGLILNQLDKVILSKLLPLKMFGYYSLAWMCANGLFCFFAPFFTVFFPRFCQLVALSDEKGLGRLYHQACQLMSVILLPIALSLCLFSKEILLMWTKDTTISLQAAPLVSILILGTALHGLMQMPFALQFAYGWTKLTFYQNLAALLLLAPLMFWGVRTYGAVGGTFAWVILNFAYILVGVHLMHRKLLIREKWVWCFQDVVLPLCGALCAVLIAKLFFNPTMLFSLIFITLITMFCTAVFTPLIRIRTML